MWRIGRNGISGWVSLKIKNENTRDSQRKSTGDPNEKWPEIHLKDSQRLHKKRLQIAESSQTTRSGLKPVVTLTFLRIPRETRTKSTVFDPIEIRQTNQIGDSTETRDRKYSIVIHKKGFSMVPMDGSLDGSSVESQCRNSLLVRGLLTFGR